MIVGRVNNLHEAVISLTVLPTRGQSHEVEAIVDTGFTGTLSFPSAVIAMLDLSFRRRGRAILADGRESLFDVYDGVVSWNGQRVRIVVDQADTDPLVGMRLLLGHRLIVDVTSGGVVTIDRLASEAE
jgi:clan AA aspartic protease